MTRTSLAGLSFVLALSALGGCAAPGEEEVASGEGAFASTGRIYDGSDGRGVRIHSVSGDEMVMQFSTGAAQTLKIEGRTAILPSGPLGPDECNLHATFEDPMIRITQHGPCAQFRGVSYAGEFKLRAPGAADGRYVLANVGTIQISADDDKAELSFEPVAGSSAKAKRWKMDIAGAGQRLHTVTMGATKVGLCEMRFERDGATFRSLSVRDALKPEDRESMDGCEIFVPFGSYTRADY